MKSRLILTVAALLFMQPAQAAESLKLVKHMPMPAVNGRIDHMAFDARRSHLFVSALGSDKVVVLDSNKGTVLADLGDMTEPQGIAYLADLDQVVVACGEGGTVDFYDAATLKRTKRLTGFDDADNVRYDPSAGKVYVGYGSGALAVFNARDQKLVETIKLPAHPESFQLDTGSPRIYVNVPNAHIVAVIDRNKAALIARWNIGARNNYPMALDSQRKLLVLGCRTPASILRLDMATGAELQSVPTHGDTDDVFIDSKTERIYEACGQGFIDVLPVAADGKLGSPEALPTKAGARTCLFVPSLKTLFLACRRHLGQAAEIQVYATNK